MIFNSILKPKFEITSLFKFKYLTHVNFLLQLLTQRKLSKVSNDVIKRLYENDIHVTVFADDEKSAGFTARTLSSNPQLYVPVLGRSELPDDGYKVVKTVCDDLPIHAPAVVLKCEGHVTSDIVVLIDRSSFVLKSSGSVADLTLQLTRALKVDGRKVRLAIVFHSDVDEPRIHFSSPDLALEDVLWEEKRRAKEVDLKSIEKLSDSVDFGPTLEFMEREPLFTRRLTAASEVFVAITGRPVAQNSKTFDALDDFELRKYTSVIVAPNSDRLVSSSRKLLKSVQFEGDALPNKVYKSTNEILDYVCSAPKRPVTESVCEAKMEVAFAADASLFNKGKFRSVTKNFFKMAAVKFGFKTTRPVVLVGNANINLGSQYDVINLNDESNELFPVSDVLTESTDFFTDATDSRKVVVLVSLRAGNSSGIEAVRRNYIEKKIRIISMVVEQEYFLPSYNLDDGYVEIPVTKENFLQDAVVSLASIACAPYEPPPPVEIPKSVVCPAGDVTFLYDVSLFSPARDGRKVTHFIKEVN